MSAPSVAVLGPGGVGGLVSVALEQGGCEVTVVARESTAEVIAADGIKVASVLFGDMLGSPRAVARLLDPVDVLVIAVKATALAPALERIGAEPGLVVPLLNGLEHMRQLRERFGSRAVAGSIRVEADRPRPGEVDHTSEFLKIELACEDPARRPGLERFAAALDASRVPAEMLDSEAQVLWSKLVRLNPLALTTSAYDVPIGRIRADPDLRAELESSIAETVAVARGEGAQANAEQTIAELEATHDTLGSSMQRDIAAGREPELDAIAGSVLRAAARHGLECPTVRRLAALVAERAAIPPPSVP